MTREELKLSAEQFLNMLDLLDDFLDKYDEEVGLVFCDVDYGLAIEQLENALQYITDNSIQLRTIYNKRELLRKNSELDCPITAGKCCVPGPCYECSHIGNGCSGCWAKEQYDKRAIR